MIAVGVRDLKNQLSQYLQYVKNGEKVVITEHNRVIAEISSPSKEVSNTDVEIELEKLAAAGKLIKAKRNNSIQLKAETPSGIDWISVYKENRES
ncbi:type II toxin-antitoxin system prevent-host-death family antitoxin [Treponema sp. J25]|uniref:type II toxin-antitoxin system Phd/YefM family antitoxin n=1 Tax=Treponema sp. J25 TaxID=2094121 RepID=UPI00104B0B23|nr:type II toxin-antitoxin system prevent-host-death family antitoxin [Treponema sp. J25]TCW60037.1 type II toxin-antitoxin system prevent-host-death family antitoxin [Treponema sp. J25]